MAELLFQNFLRFETALPDAKHTVEAEHVESRTRIVVRPFVLGLRAEKDSDAGSF